MAIFDSICAHACFEPACSKVENVTYFMNLTFDRNECMVNDKGLIPVDINYCRYSKKHIYIAFIIDSSLMSLLLLLKSMLFYFSLPILLATYTRQNKKY